MKFTRHPNHFLVPFLYFYLKQWTTPIEAFSANKNLGIALDRFQVTCPADPSCIQQFDSKLVQSSSTSTSSFSNGIWAAVYRSNQNQPSVFVRDEFFHAMKDATTTTTTTTTTTGTAATWADKLQTPLSLTKPVAVAQLRPSPDLERTWILDSLQCALKKEDIDDNCDGGSEFLEALSVAIDSLLLFHLKKHHQSSSVFEGTIRIKATLFCHRLLEDRGFSPVETLSKDMATHISSLEGCLQQYAARSVDTRLNPAARDRALQIVSWLGQMDRSDDLKKKKKNNNNNNDEDGGGIDEGNDPWANIKMQL